VSSILQEVCLLMLGAGCSLPGRSRVVFVGRSSGWEMSETLALLFPPLQILIVADIAGVSVAHVVQDVGRHTRPLTCITIQVDRLIKAPRIVTNPGSDLGTINVDSPVKMAASVFLLCPDIYKQNLDFSRTPRLLRREQERCQHQAQEEIQSHGFTSTVPIYTES
jgi:hypothetical protein